MTTLISPTGLRRSRTFDINDLSYDELAIDEEGYQLLPNRCKQSLKHSNSLSSISFRSRAQVCLFVVIIISCSLLGWLIVGNRSINQQVHQSVEKLFTPVSAALIGLMDKPTKPPTSQQPVHESIDLINQSIDQFPVHSQVIAGHCWNASLSDPWDVRPFNHSFVQEAAYMMYHDYQARFPNVHAMINQTIDLNLRSRLYALTRSVHERYEAAKRNHVVPSDLDPPFERNYGYIDMQQHLTGTMPSLHRTQHSQKINLTLVFQDQTIKQSVKQSNNHFHVAQLSNHSVPVIEWDQSKPLIVYVISTEINPPVRQCSGGLPMMVHFEHPALRRRPLVRDWYQGVYQIIINNDLPIHMTGNSVLRVHHEWESFMIDIKLTKQSNKQSIKHHQCSLRDFSTIDDEWIGDWMKLAASRDNPLMEPTPSLKLKKGVVLADGTINQSKDQSKIVLNETSTLCDGDTCSGVFPSFHTFPFAWEMPWMYRRSTCHFHMYSIPESWSCMNNTWLLIVGDSTMQDYIRNFIGFPLGRRERWLHGPMRESDEVVYSPDGKSRMRITQVWGGAPLREDNGYGMFTFANTTWVDHLGEWFDGDTHAIKGLPTVPNHVIYISGLHDGISSGLLDGRGGWMNNKVPKPNHDSSLYQSINLSNDRIIYSASNSYRDQVRSVLEVFHRFNQLHPNHSTRFLWRTTVAPAGHNSIPSTKGANAYSVRMLNSVVISEMKYYQQQSIDHSTKPIQWLLDDQYDLSHAWNEEPIGMYSDGGHYGRMPGPNGEGDCLNCAHNPFVEVMQTHVALNLMCAD